MTTSGARTQTRLQKLGWAILLTLAALLLLNGLFWLFEGPDIALENIAERTSLAPGEFRQGNPSAFDVISLINRNYAVLELGLALFAALVAWRGYRHGSPWAWKAAGVLVASLVAIAVNFTMIGGLGGGSVGYLTVAAVGLVALLLAARG